MSVKVVKDGTEGREHWGTMSEDGRTLRLILFLPLARYIMDDKDLHPSDDYSHRFFIWHEWIQESGPDTVHRFSYPHTGTGTRTALYRERL